MAEPSILGALARGLAPIAKAYGSYQGVPGDRTWFPIIREPFSGAWQKGEEIRVGSVAANPTVFRCATLIASDIAKMCVDLVEEDSNGIWSPTTSPAFSPVLARPNRYQNRIQFILSWQLSKLFHGNTYVLKERDGRGVVVAKYLLDPTRVKPLVAPDGAVFYQLYRDNLSGITDDMPAVPASEIIHDRINTIFHPLVGLSPIFACGMAAVEAQEIQAASTRFFRNGSKPGGILTAPGAIDDTTAKRLKDHWEEKFTGDNVGKVAVLGSGLEYKTMAVTAVDAQLIEQLKWTAETICSVFGVPAYMVGVGPAPLNNNVEALAQQYYSQCLQIHIASMELCLTEGLALPDKYAVRCNLDDLLRMDTATQIETLSKAVLGGLMKPNEGRAKINAGPVPGGDSVYLQVQNYSLAALAKRDAKTDPFAAAAPKAEVGSSNPEPVMPPAPAANDKGVEPAFAMARFAQPRKAA